MTYVQTITHHKIKFIRPSTQLFKFKEKFEREQTKETT